MHVQRPLHRVHYAFLCVLASLDLRVLLDRALNLTDPSEDPGTTTVDEKRQRLTRHKKDHHDCTREFDNHTAAT